MQTGHREKLSARLTTFFKSEKLLNFKLGEITFEIKEEENAREIVVFFLVDDLAFKEIPFVQALAGFRVNIFAYSNRISQADLSGLLLEIHGVDNKERFGKMALENFVNRFQVFVKEARPTLTRIVSEVFR